MVTKLVFLIIIFAVIIQRILEIFKSRKNVSVLKKQGAIEHASGHFRIMLLLHTSWFIAMIAEVFILERPFIPLLFSLALIFSVLGNWLRYQSMLALGTRWTIRIYTLPNANSISSGIYKHVKHPIYLGVILEIAFIPLLHTAFLTSIFFTIANAALLTKRIHEEEKALSLNSDYKTAFKNKPIFLPKF